MSLDNIKDKNTVDAQDTPETTENENSNTLNNITTEDKDITKNDSNPTPVPINLEKINENSDENEETFSLKDELISWVQTIVFAVFLAFLVNNFIIVNAKVPTGSMENSVMTGDRIIAFRGAYWFDTPEQGDIIVFKYPDDPTGETLYLKRVIGIAGDEILINNGDVYINDVLTVEPYINEVTLGNFGPYLVPEGHCFAMGDNRNSSEDSRYWKNTYVPNDDILGKVAFSYYKDFDWLW